MSTAEERCSCLVARQDIALVAPSNAPGLSAVAYRIGRHGDFKRRLLAGLSAEAYGALAGLKTRADDDFTVALLDAFAAMADVLGFYQERIANESYLRTATERRSVLELARLTGYRPSPGVAAEVALAFTLEDAPGAAQPPVQEVVIPVGAQVRSVPGPDETAQTFETVEAITARYEWNALAPVTSEPQSINVGTEKIWVDGVDTRVRVGDGLLLRKKSDTDIDFCTVVSVIIDTTHGITCLNLSSKPRKDYELADSECFVFRQRAAVFGHNAPNPCLLNLSTLPKASDFYNLNNCQWNNFDSIDTRLELDGVYTGIADGSLCVLLCKNERAIHRVTGTADISAARFGLNQKLTGVALGVWEDLPKFTRRGTTVYLQSDQLSLSPKKPLPPNEKVSGSTVTVQGTLEPMPPAGQLGVLLEVDGKGGWAPRELIEIQSPPEPDGETTILKLTGSLTGSYVPANVRINLNIAQATHGETVHEILGSGDARIPHQRFMLKQPSLTYVPVDGTVGAESTLEVRVDDLLWKERESFAHAGPRDRVYTQSIADDGTVTLQFGDGVNGARLPSGQSNVRARYCKGIGLGGLVGAGQLSLLMTRPLGVKAVVNPQSAAGAEDPETLDTARTTAPTRVLTLDRAVSLKDYENYARTFPGIAKARADVHPNQPGTIFVTVAGAKGAGIPKDSDLAKRLSRALLAAGNPHLSIQVQSYRPVPFALAARIEVGPGYLKERVAAAVETALADAFSFENSVLGGRIWRSRVIALIQQAPGVAAVDMERFTRAATVVMPSPAAPSGSWDWNVHYMGLGPIRWSPRGPRDASLCRVGHPLASRLGRVRGHRFPLRHPRGPGTRPGG